MNLIEGERPERWLIFETNQGTDDHVSGGPPFGSWSTVRWSGAVQSLPRILPGGHVVVRVANLDFTAYEPSKQFRSVVRKLVPGDRVQAVGALRRRPNTLHLEKVLQVQKPRTAPHGPPPLDRPEENPTVLQS